MRQEVNELESVQRHFTRRLADLRGYSYRERLRNLSLLSLESQRQMADYLTIYKIIHKQIGISTQDAGLNLSTCNTRGGGLRLLQHCATSVSASSHFKFKAASLWNSLPTDLLQLPKLSLFKSAIRNKLLADDLAFFD